MRRRMIQKMLWAAIVVCTLSTQAHAQNSGVTPPVIIKEVHPKGDKTAHVTFDCVVQQDGTVTIVKILSSSDAKLNDDATAAMKQWQFKPGTKDGKPVAVRVAIDLSFRP